jgi:hypothetical protein
MLFGHKRNPYDNNNNNNNNNNNKERYRDYEINWRDNDGSSTLRDIKVKLFPDRLEIEKLDITIPFSSLDNCDRRVLIRRIINEISASTGVPEDDLLIRYT